MPGERALYRAELEVRRAKQDVVVALFERTTGRLFETRKVIDPPAARSR